MRRLLPLLIVALPARADDKSVSFVRDVRPILAKNCFGCHGPDEKARKGDLRLDTKEAALRKDAPAMPGGQRLSDFKLLFPQDIEAFTGSHATFVKEWNSMMGL